MASIPRQIVSLAAPSLSFVRVAAALSALLGVIVLFGWAVNAPALRSVFPGAVEMKANTAVALIAAAAALWISAGPRAAGLQRLAQGLSAIVALLGLATVCQYVFGWNLGIDELLVRDTADVYNQAKGRMSPYSAVAFAALGAVLGGLPYRPAGAVVRALAGLVAIIGTLSFLGYLWNASEIVTDRWAPPVALNTAWAFMLLGGATLRASVRTAVSRERRVRSRSSIEANMLIGFALVVLLLIVGGGYTYRSGAEFANAVEGATRAQEVRAQLGRLYVSLSDAESAQRNYVLVAKRILKDEFDGHTLEARIRVEAIGRMVQDNPSQLRLFANMRTLVHERIAGLEAVGKAFETRGELAARAVIATEEGARTMQDLRDLSREMDDAEADLSRARDVRAGAHLNATLVSLLVTLVVATGLFALLFRSIRLEMLARNAAEEDIRRLNTGLEQRVAERTAELSYQQAFLRKVIDLNRSFIFTKDREGRFVLANEAVAEAYGTTVDALLGKSDGDFNPNADEVRHFQATDLEVIESGRELVIDEEKITDAAGRVRWLHTVKRPILMSDGTATMLLGVSNDITSRKAAEEEVRELSVDLERRVDERTRDLQASNQKLEQARLDAEEANRAKSAFLATMSHEIRTPMNGVIGMVEVLAQSRLDEQQRDAVQIIRGSSFALLELIDDVLDFSKIEAGRLDLERTPVTLAEMVEGLCRSLAPVAAEKGVTLRVFVDPALPERLWADPTRLRQVLTNLVGNAIKFSGGRAGVLGRVSVRAQKAEGDGPAWTLQVADNGIGMTGATLLRLFTSFAQAESSTTRRFGGSGLGLAISHRLVTLMNGSIEVDSEPARGSTFTVRLPLDPVVGHVARALPDLQGLECVLVESLDLDFADLAAYFELAGATVHRVTDAAAAVAAARRLSMPVLIAHQERGPEAALIPPAFEHAPHVRKVLLTAQRDGAAAWHGRNIVAIDGNGLGRAALLRAVAAAAGRASPEVAPSERGPDAAPPARRAPTIEEARASGSLILVAEDDAVNRKVILRQLALLGHAAEIADDGLKALELWRGGGHGLLLTDLHMPLMDGYTLAASIRREESGRLPILALTANALRGEAARARAAGFDEYLTKPVQLRQLGAAIDKWLGGPHPEVTSAEESSGPASVLDLAILTRLVGDDDEVMRQFLTDFRASASALSDEIRHAAARQDSARIAACAHKLKSSSRSVGALALGDICAALETASHKGSRVDVARHFETFETVLAAVGTRLDLHLTAEPVAAVQ